MSLLPLFLITFIACGILLSKTNEFTYLFKYKSCLLSKSFERLKNFNALELLQILTPILDPSSEGFATTG